MKAARIFVLCLPIIVVLASLTGCNEKAESAVAERRACLAKLSAAYHEFNAKNDATPKSIEELAGFVEGNGADETETEAIKRLRDRDIVLFWNADPVKLTSGEFLLGFEASCPGNGGYMVKADGFVDHVTAKEFMAMKEIPKLGE